MSSASTGGTEGSSPASSPASAASLTMAAPKYGTLVPNRIFVGGISASTSEAELAQLFSAYGNVKATKIISDRAGVSKGYGFVTFETEEEAKRLQQEAECIVLRERKLNIAPAIKKQPFSRSFDGSTGSPPSVPTSTYYYANGMGLAYQNGMTFYNTAAPAPATSIAPPTDPGTIYQATGVFGPQAATNHQTFAPVMYPCPAPSLYMPQQYQYSPMPYEQYYAGAAAAAGAPQYLYTTTGGSPSNTSNGGGGGGGNGNSSGSNGNNGTGATSPPTGPSPPLPPQHPTHFYAPAAPPPHHHPPVPAGPPPPPAQVDHLYYPFATGPHPALPPPPHAPMGLTEQQLLLYATDATSCQQTSTSDSQTAPQEDSRPTPSHSEQPHGETQQASSGSPGTPLVPLMPVKFPVSGRYHANYHPIAIHTAPQNDSEDCAASPMHCRAILYHPTVYISHAHAPPPYTHHNASSGSLLPTPFSASPRQSSYDINTKTHGHNSRDCGGNKYMGGQGGNNGLRGQGGQGHGYPLNTHAPKSQNTQGGSQSHNSGRCSGNGGVDGYSHKYSTIAVSSRLPVQYNRRTAGSNVGSSAILRSGSGGYGSSQTAHKFNHATASNYGGSYKSSNANIIHGYEYSSNGRTRNCSDDHYYEIGAAGNNKSMGNGGYGSMGRRNYLSNNNYRGGAARLDLHVGNDNNGRPNNNDASKTDNAAVVVTSTTSTTTTTLSSRLSPAERANADASKDAQEKPASPPPAPYSPMTRPLPTLSPPTPQVQFYAPVQNRYQSPSMPSSQLQQQQQHPANSQRSRYSVGQTLANRKPSDKYSNATGSSQTTMLRQSAKYKMNGIMQTAATTMTSKLADDNLGGAGDGPGRLPLSPPNTPRASGHPAAGDQNQLSDTCHQMQALTL
ncbi:trithorax group protein osa-like isoform X1 [Formica exsecta]|uniref:trithorax group protein osa-like isoform X1 n=1 Tax=Formica exsecta TaxID=72781 RepID=UPI001144DE07|nr:trithorax group protein osa-like isoform X1 [Formica exsecta]XP_029670616.1 trithorax group protein osa-like isoform X1 [Formica exsecta]